MEFRIVRLLPLPPPPPPRSPKKGNSPSEENSLESRVRVARSDVEKDTMVRLYSMRRSCSCCYDAISNLPSVSSHVVAAAADKVDIPARVWVLKSGSATSHELPQPLRGYSGIIVPAGIDTWLAIHREPIMNHHSAQAPHALARCRMSTRFRHPITKASGTLDN